jgi:hypothetical protein
MSVLSTTPITAETISATAAALAGDGTTIDERRVAYATLEDCCRTAGWPAPPSVVALLAAAVKPLITGVLTAPVSKVGPDEYTRASLLLYEMVTTDVVAVSAEVNRNDVGGVPLCFRMFMAEDTAFAAVMAKDPAEFTREDAIIASVNMAHHVPTWANGISATLAEADVDEMEWFQGLFRCSPCVSTAVDPFSLPHPDEANPAPYHTHR